MKTTINLLISFFVFWGITSYSQILQIDKIEPDEFGRWFGGTVVMEGDMVVVGCPYDTTNGQSSGSVYIYDLTEKSLLKIIGADVDKDDIFGLSIAIDNQTIAVGAPHSGAYWEGAVYIFRKNLSGEWIQEAKLTKSSAGEQFGRGVSIDGDQLMIGADHDSAYIYVRTADSTWIKDAVISDVLYPRLVCINGNYAAVCDPAGFNEEDVYIYHKADTVWNLLQGISAIEGQGQVLFGQSVAMQNDHLVIGSPRHGTLNSSATIVGAVYVYKLNNTVFELDTILFRANIHQQSLFGTSVDISDNLITVGAPNFNQGGGVFLYEKIGDNWIELSDTIKADDAGNSDSFGNSIAISGDHIIVGAPQHNPIDFLSSYGAAYIFENGYITGVQEKKMKESQKSFCFSKTIQIHLIQAQL